MADFPETLFCVLTSYLDEDDDDCTSILGFKSSDDACRSSDQKECKGVAEYRLVRHGTPKPDVDREILWGAG